MQLFLSNFLVLRNIYIYFPFNCKADQVVTTHELLNHSLSRISLETILFLLSGIVISPNYHTEKFIEIQLLGSKQSRGKTSAPESYRNVSQI